MVVELASEHVQQELSQLISRLDDGWELQGKSINRDSKFKDFLEAFSFMARVAVLAESRSTS